MILCSPQKSQYLCGILVLWGTGEQIRTFFHIGKKLFFKRIQKMLFLYNTQVFSVPHVPQFPNASIYAEF